MGNEKRFRVTVTLKAEDLMATPEEDGGSEAIIINNTVSAETRHMMEKVLSEAMVKMGDDAQAAKKGGK